MYGLCTVCVRLVYGLCAFCIRFVYGLCVVYVQFVYGLFAHIEPAKIYKKNDSCNSTSKIPKQLRQTLTHLHIVGTHYWNFCHKMASPGTRTPRPRAVWHKQNGFAVLMETTRGASLSASQNRRYVSLFLFWGHLNVILRSIVVFLHYTIAILMRLPCFHHCIIMSAKQDLWRYDNLINVQLQGVRLVAIGVRVPEYVLGKVWCEPSGNA